MTLATFLMVLIAAPSFTSAFAMEGGANPATNSAVYPAPSSPPSSHPRQSGIKATHKIKKTTKRSSIRRPGI